ncbi:MAG: site-specific integrase [Chloroflexi bacterium]|nr:site-specific integrase [Chloroflexota bacterium]
MPDAGKMTVGGFMAHWLEQTQARVRPKTFYDYEIIARLHIVPHVGHLRLSRLTPLRIARLYADLSKTQSPRRVAQVHCLLHKALGDARKWGLISENPTDMVDAPKRPQVERKLWTPDQVAAFLRAILDGKGGRYGALFGFLLASGCRLGEALGLRWSDVDWEAGTVRIERQVTELRSKPIECPPKTRAGIRTITLPTWGVTLLRHQWLRALAEGHGDRVFCTEAGTVPLQSNVRRALRGFCAKVGLPAIRVHDLRHTSLSLLAMSGVPLKAAQQRAGHSSAQITLETYQHVLGDGDQAAAKALDRVLG